jgi:hypothetical protein
MMDEQRYIEIEKRLRTRPLYELGAIADGYNSAIWGEEGLLAAAALVRERQQPRPTPPPKAPPPPQPVFTRPRIHPFPGADWKRLAEELEGMTPFAMQVDPRRYLTFAEDVVRFARFAPGGVIAIAFAVACILLAFGAKVLVLWPGLPLLVGLFLLGCLFGAAVNVAAQRRLIRQGEDLGLF